MATTTPNPVAHRHHCIYCQKPTAGKPKRKKCATCGGSFSVETGAHGVFEWTGAGRYPRDAALSLHRTPAAAEKAAGTEYVVRWVPADD